MIKASFSQETIVNTYGIKYTVNMKIFISQFVTSKYPWILNSFEYSLFVSNFIPEVTI